MYRNGSPVKQSRGAVFRDSAEEMLRTVRGLTDAQKGITRSEADKAKRYIFNIPR